MELGKSSGMRVRSVKRCALASLLLWASLAHAIDNQPGEKPKRISAEDFGALPFMVSPVISPDGHLAAARAYVRDSERLVILDLDKFKPAFGAIPIPDKKDLLWYRWAGNDRLILSVGSSDKLEGDDVYVTRLLVLDLKTSQIQFVGKTGEGIEGDDVIYVAPDGSDLLL